MININPQNKKKLIFALIIIVILAIAWILISQSNDDLTPEEQVKKAQNEAAQVKDSLGKHLILPEGDEPDIRRITEKVADPFFNKAEVGDYLVIFYKSRIAYIYSMDKDIIVNAGVVFTNLPEDQNKKGVNLDPKATATSTATTTKR